ncbi:hypothetical protein F542_6500 [Bibersteinia trehalosi USDA-ARS-USMARC-188]|uniref:Uncharacterized protein n=2 Tax=Bibersteinia trehalosi TaxID=47735 RepID=A0A4V7I8L3_BIBTR|nr:hypothetical protein F542_6500 [Bibersteinia trehalosi USDA-ARS-USMARC-188]AHG83632.1 hypothetical protein F543_7680 [Bibersteinia trehalosi USDA-ARS-USMARC-189]
MLSTLAFWLNQLLQFCLELLCHQYLMNPIQTATPAILQHKISLYLRPKIDNLQ